MTYAAGSDILASDYNGFAAIMNELFADSHSGATTLPNAGFGYGQGSTISNVLASSNITAAQWGSLFDTIRKTGTHQGTTTVPPLPASNPLANTDIITYNTPSTLSTLLALLQTNKFNLAIGQSTLVVGTNYDNVSSLVTPWTNTLTWNYQVDFSTWNNARYFFNSGGTLNLNGSYAPVSTPEDTQWSTMLTNMSPLVFNYNSTTPNTGSGGTAIGFYGLTTSYQTIYTVTFGGGGYYTNSFIQVQAKLNAAAGTNGKIDFTILLNDQDVSPDSKSNTTTYHVDYRMASGVNVAYPGTVSVATVGANNGFIAT